MPRKRIITVIVTSKDRYELLQNAIESVFRQTFKHWEMIIVDDDSKDPRIHEFLTELAKDKYIQVIRGGPANEQYRQQYKMVAVRINSALEFCSGEYITYLCDDDYFLPNRFQQMIDVFKSDREIDMVVNQVKWITWDGRFFDQDKVKYNYPKPYKPGHANLLKAIEPSNFIVHDCVMHKEIVRKCCRWPVDMKDKTPVDWRFWLRLHDSEGYRIKKINEVGAIAYFPGTWKTKTVQDVLQHRQDLREVKMVNRNRLREKRKEDENRVEAEEDMTRMVVNTSGKRIQITTNNVPIRVPVDGEIEEKFVATANGGIMPGFSYKSRAVPKPMKQVLAEKPRQARDYGFDVVSEPEPEVIPEPKPESRLRANPKLKAARKKKFEFACSVCGRELRRKNKTGLCGFCYRESIRKK